MGAARGVISSFLKSSLVSLDLKRHAWLLNMHSHKVMGTGGECGPLSEEILTEQRLCDRPPHGLQGPEDWSNSQLNKTRKRISDFHDRYLFI